MHKDFPIEDLKTVLEDHMLLNNPNVIITPHNAFNSTEALQRILNTTSDNILGFLAGTPKNPAY
jgi:D-lactate dehydrogenase